MNRTDTHPMALDDARAEEPRQVKSWADDYSRPWSETMPAPDPLATARRAPASAARGLATWGLVAASLGLAFLALRWMLQS